MKRVAAILRREGTYAVKYCAVLFCGTHFFSSHTVAAEIYSDVLEDYYAYNKIPRIIFMHRLRLDLSRTLSALPHNVCLAYFSKLAGEIRVNVGNVRKMTWSLIVCVCVLVLSGMPLLPMTCTFPCLQPLSLAFILQLYHSIDCRVHQLGVLFRYWAKVCFCTLIQVVYPGSVS
jgi:hypothetical protein